MLGHAVRRLTKNHAQLQSTDTSLIDTFFYPRKGPGQMWQRVADEVVSLGGEIRYGISVEFNKQSY